MRTEYFLEFEPRVTAYSILNLAGVTNKLIVGNSFDRVITTRGIRTEYDILLQEQSTWDPHTIVDKYVLRMLSLLRDRSISARYDRSLTSLDGAESSRAAAWRNKDTLPPQTRNTNKDRKDTKIRAYTGTISPSITRPLDA